MAFVFTCTQCQKRHQIDDETVLGKKVRCSCGNVVKLAAPKTEAPIEEVPLEEVPLEEVPLEPTALVQSAPVPITPVPISPVAPAQPAAVPQNPMQHDPMLGAGASVFDAGSPAGPAPTYPPPTARQKPREQGKQYSKQAVTRMLMSMAAGTMLVVFAIIVIAGAMYFFGQASDVAERKKSMASWDRSFSGEVSRQASEIKWSSSETRMYRNMLVLGCLTLLVGVLCIVAGCCQYTVSWMRFLKSYTRFSWADAMVAAVSVVALVAILIGCFYANYQVAQMYSIDPSLNNVPQGNSAMARQAQERMKEVRKSQSKVRGEMQWTIAKQGFIHAVFPCLALGICGFRIFRE